MHPRREVRTGHADPPERRSVVRVVRLAATAVAVRRGGREEGISIVVVAPASSGGAIPTVHVHRHRPLGNVFGGHHLLLLGRCPSVHLPVAIVVRYRLGNRN